MLIYVHAPYLPFEYFENPLRIVNESARHTFASDQCSSQRRFSQAISPEMKVVAFSVKRYAGLTYNIAAID